MHPDELRHHLADNHFGEQRARDNAAWWRELSGDEQRALIDSHPREIGNAEGIPAWARTEASEHELSRLHDGLQSRRDAGERLHRSEVKELKRYNDIRRALDDAKAKAARLGGEVHILAFDPHAFHGDGRMVVSVGHDPHHADAVSWHVPGFSTTIESLGGNLDNALHHLESVRSENPAARVASIAWIGYDAPQGIKGLLDVIRTRMASDGGAILHSDLAAFNAGRDGFAGDGSHFSNNDVFGHSYGSTTTSFAGRDGNLAAHARSITLLGSPGAGPLRHASEFQLGDRVFVAASSRDFVTMFGGRMPESHGRFFGRGLGIDPSMHTFGAHRVTAEFPRYMDHIRGADANAATHSAYYRFDSQLAGIRTESLANFGRIGAGMFDRVHTEQHRFALDPSERGWPRTVEPARHRALENTRDPAELGRRVWDPRWHSPDGTDHPGAHVVSEPGDARCAHNVTDFLAERYGRDVVLQTQPGPHGVPARDLFETWHSAAHFASYREVHDALLRHGDGSAAVLASQWSGGPGQGGHAYVAVNERGTVYLYERVGDGVERSGWPPWWGEHCVDRTAVGFLDPRSNPIDPLDGRPGELHAAEAVGAVAGKDALDGPGHEPGPNDGAAAPVAHSRDYDIDGRTIPTDQLIHPDAALLDQGLLDSAAANPHRVSDALSPGAPSTHPEVQEMVHDNYDPLGGLTQAEWERTYWPTGNRDAHGNPELVWPDPQTHPQGFSTPEARAPRVLNPGELFDRFGPGFGGFGSPVGTPFPERALPAHSLDAGYHRYEVVRPIPIWEGSIAPAMGQPGGGIQYYFTRPIVDLVNAGYLREIPL